MQWGGIWHVVEASTIENGVNVNMKMYVTGRTEGVAKPTNSALHFVPAYDVYENEKAIDG